MHVKQFENRNDLVSSIEDGQIDYSIVDLQSDSIATHTETNITNLGTAGFIAIMDGM